MVTPPEMVIYRLNQLGFFQFWLPFFLTSAIFYGLLRKSKLFGEPERNVVVNGVVSLVAAFMVWAAPILAGIDIQTQLVKFFLQSIVGMLMVIVGLMITSMFVGPDLPAKLAEKFGAGSPFWPAVIIFGILLSLVILFSSGLANILFPTGEEGEAVISEDVMLTILTLVAMFGMIGVIAWVAK